MQTVTLFAPDISCGHCRQHIETDLGKLAGISKVDATVDTKMVEIEFDPAQISLDTIKHALSEAGYPAQDVAA